MDEYKIKLISAKQVGDLVNSGDYIDLYGYYAAGDTLDRALAAKAGEVRNIKVRTMSKHNGNWSFLEADNQNKAFIHVPIFLGPVEMRQVDQVNQAPIPALFYEYPQMYRKGDLPVDVGSRQVSPMDNDGYFSFSSSIAYSKALAEASKIFIAEINASLPPLPFGHEDRRIHISQVDYIVDGNDPVPVEQPDPVPTEIDKKIAVYILNEIHNGSCLQVGFGKVPMAVTSLIAESDLHDLGIHTELMSDSLMKLYNAGLVTNRHKTINKGQIVYTIAAGSHELYEFVTSCKDMYGAPVDYVNDVYLIGSNDNVVSINSCLEFDLTGHVSAESIGTRQISGTGGQLDFIMGSYRSKGGKSIITCPSTYKKKDGSTASRIVPVLSPGVGVTDPRMCVHYFCTEYGITNVKGASMWERVERIIGIAHPDFRDDLTREAEKLGLWTRTNKIT
jgi:acyl-CoA hydrolase